MPNDSSSVQSFLQSLSPEEVLTLFAKVRNMFPIGAAAYSPELNAGESEIVAKRRAERDAARQRELEILEQVLPQTMASRRAMVGVPPVASDDLFVPTRTRVEREQASRLRELGKERNFTPAPKFKTDLKPFAMGGEVLADHTVPDWSDGGRTIADPQPFAGGGGVLKSALGLAEKPTKTNIRNLIEKVRNEEGTFEARRLQRAADEVPNLESMYREGALERLFGGDNAKALMTMRPRDFEKYAAPLKPRSRTATGSGPKKEHLSTDEYVRYLSGINEFHDVPFLEINKEMQGSTSLPFISGHEGRHRNRALAERGEQTGLVQLLPRSQLREPFPRRDREDFLEALRKELSLTEGMVRPETYFDDILGDNFKRAPIKLPELYAEGGSVKTFAGGGKAFGKSVEEMRKELLTKEGKSRRALFGLSPDYPLAKITEPLSKVEQEVQRAERAARSKGEAPSITTSRVDVDPGAGRKKSIMESITETPVSRRTVLKTAGSQVAQNVLPMGDLAKLIDAPMPTSFMRTAAPAVTADLAPALMIKAIQMGMNEDQAVKYVREALKDAAPTKTYDLSRAPEVLPSGGTFDAVQNDLGILYDTMAQPFGASEKFEFFGPMRPSNTLSLLMGAKDVENPSVMQMRGALRQIKEADPQLFRSLLTEARDLAEDYGQQAIESGMISPKNLERYMKGKDIEPQYRPGALSQ